MFRFDESLHDIGCPTGESHAFCCNIKRLKTVQARVDVISAVCYLQTFRHVYQAEAISGGKPHSSPNSSRMTNRICNDRIIAYSNFQYLISFENLNQKFCRIRESGDLTGKNKLRCEIFTTKKKLIRPNPKGNFHEAIIRTSSILIPKGNAACMNILHGALLLSSVSKC